MLSTNNILILGSAPNSILAREWTIDQFKSIVAINNAWKIRPDWTHNIFPSDFPKEKRPKPSNNQHLISAKDYVSIQNLYGGFVYAGGTMALTAAYWTLGVLKPDNLFFLGCDMIYKPGQTHFYGIGTPDPLRKDITLRSLEAKASRFECFAALVGCNVFNLSEQKESRLTYRRKIFSQLFSAKRELPREINKNRFEEAIKLEDELDYFIPDGKYWKHESKFKTREIDRLDKIWLSCIDH